MKKTIISLFLTALSIFASAQGNADTLRLNDRQTLEEVQVITTRTQLASEKLRVISTISRQEIQNLPVQSVIDLLEYLPGVDIRTRGGNGVQSDISMRGGTFDQVVILVNGINITDPQTGHHNTDIPTDLALIDRIEILQGTSMNIFGLSGFSGAINIITGTSDESATTATISAGDHSFISSSVAAHYNMGGWKLSGSASYNQSAGYMHNTDYQYGNATMQAIYSDSAAGRFNFLVTGQLKGFGANSFYSLAYPDQYEATKTLFSSLVWDKRIGDFGLEAAAYYRTHLDRFELIKEGVEAPSWYTGHNHHITHLSGAYVKGAWFSRIGRTSVGVEMRNERINSNVLGEPIDKPIHVPGQPDSVQFTFSKNRLNINYFAEQAFFVGRLSASVGVSGNYNSMFRNNFAATANIGYEFARGANVFASASRSLRLPTFTDLYYKSATQIANPELKPEENITAELGLNYSGHGFSAHLSGYYRSGRNIIDWIKRPEEEQWRSLNHTAVNAAGVEASVGYSFGEWLPRAEVSYSFCNLDKKAGDYLSKYALDYLRHKLSLAVNHKIYRGFGANWQLTFQQRNGEYTNIEGSIETYKPILLLDGQIFWQGQKIKLYIESTNLTNRRYYDYGGILQPGIWAKGGIAVKI